jgi:hypothetical protein
MTGLKGSLDDAYEHAVKLRTALLETVYSTEHLGGPTLELGDILGLGDIYDEVDDLASRIDNLRNQLRT